MPVVLGLLFLLGSVGIATAAEPEVTKHGDWTNVCRVAENSQRQCSSTQLLTRQLGDGQSARILQTTVRRINESDYLIQFLLPLGVDLRPGIAFQVDDKDRRGAQYFTCTNTGCIVRMGMDQAFIGELQGGAKARIIYRAVNSEQPAAIDISLKGITAATNAL